MFVRKGVLPLLMIGFLSSLFFVTRLIIKEKKISPSTTATVTLRENGKLTPKSNLTVKTSVSYFTPKSD